MSSFPKVLIILIHAFLGWAFCAAVMGIGMSILPLPTTLIIHAIMAPIIFFGDSSVYYRKFNYTTPLQTAFIFTFFVISMDFFVVAMLIQHSFAMFTSLIGTWIPFVLIYLATFLTGRGIVLNKE